VHTTLSCPYCHFKLCLLFLTMGIFKHTGISACMHLLLDSLMSGTRISSFFCPPGPSPGLAQTKQNKK
jgi:hypothetical protein